MKAYTRMVLSELIRQAELEMARSLDLCKHQYYKGRHDALTEVDLMVSNDFREIRELLDTELQKNKDLNARLDGQKMIILDLKEQIANSGYAVLRGQNADLRDEIEELQQKLHDATNTYFRESQKLDNELKVYQASDRIKNENIKTLEKSVAHRDRRIEQLRNRINLFGCYPRYNSQ